MATLDLIVQAGLWRVAGAVMQSMPLTALVWLLCRFVHRLGPSARCWLWWLVSLQLLAGLVWPTPVSLPLLPAQDPARALIEAPAVLHAKGPTLVQVQLDGAVAVSTVAVSGGADSAVASLPAVSSHLQAGGASTWAMRLLLIAWLAGVGAMATRSLLDLRATRRRLRTCSARVPADVLTRYQLLAARLGVRRAPPLKLCAQLDSPQLCGFWRPQLLLPATQLPRMSADAIEMALHHELVHLRRADLLWGWVPALAQHLFFFHPLAHLAAREYALAREAACDAAVLAGDRHAPQDYGRLLLQFGVAPRAVAVVGAASPNFILLKRRLTMLQSPTAPWRAGAFALIAAVAVLGVMPYRVVAAAQDDQDPAHRANLAAADPVEPATTAAAKPVARTAPSASVQPATSAKPVASAQTAVSAKTVTSAAPVASAKPVASAQTAVAARSAVAPRVSASTRTSDWMPAPPAPPAAPAAPAPMARVPAPPSVTAPAAPSTPPAVTAPAAPPAPEPPLPPGAMRGTFSFVDKGDAKNAWVLMEGDHVHAFGTPDDLRQARVAQRGNEAMWWFREGNQRYVVRDAATLAQLKQAYAPLQTLGRQQSELGRQQGELGAQQGELGAAQGELGARQGDIGARQAKMSTRIAQLALEHRRREASGQTASQESQQQVEREQQALSQQIQALAAKQQALGARQQALGNRQGALGLQQGDLGKRQEVALEQLRAQGEKLARAAIASGKAERL
ncbi:MAG TPA: M56 family metallopeptidase [Stenotrophomonas sp.]|jgi:beta-lactamase regulating signal transducer with metallopeptidase domain